MVRAGIPADDIHHAWDLRAGTTVQMLLVSRRMLGARSGQRPMTLEVVVIALGSVLFLGVALLPVVVLVALANRHLSGRRSRGDGLFEGIGRAAQMNSHLQAGTPEPDDLGLQVPPRPDGMPARRRRRRR
jgi:hypothetical protein